MNVSQNLDKAKADLKTAKEALKKKSPEEFRAYEIAFENHEQADKDYCEDKGFVLKRISKDVWDKINKGEI